MKTILLLILVHYIVLLVRKKQGYRSNVLSCGLFGWVGDDPSKFNKDKFDKLGIYNISRGKHSCGQAIDGELYKGIKNQANYQDFIANNITPSPVKSSVVIGHTRHATVGSHTLENAHPFKFDYKDEGYFIGAHNGTLINHKDLAKKYGIKGNKIDSQILLEIISKGDKNINVLSEYFGAAALLMHTSKKLDTMYLFRGKSKNLNSHNAEVEERPLFYWQQSENSMYISSLKDSLYAIMDCEADKDNIFEVSPNCIYEIKGGKIQNKYVIDRSKVRENYYANLRANNNNTKTNKNTSTNTTSTTKMYNVDNLFYEKPIIKNNMNTVVYNKLRFWDNNKLLQGIYIFIDDVGYVKLCDKMEDRTKALKDFNFVDKSNEKDGVVDTINFGNIEGVSLFYFFEGVQLELPEDYSTCLNPSRTKNKYISYEDLVDMSRYPIIDIKRLNTPNTVIPRTQQNAKENLNRLYSGTIKVPGTYQTYFMNTGDLTHSTILKEMIPEDTDKFITLGLYEYINDSNIEDEDDVEDVSFENNVKDLVNNDDADEIDMMIEIINNYEVAISESENLQGSKSRLAQMLVEASASARLLIKPIADVLEKANNEK